MREAAIWIVLLLAVALSSACREPVTSADDPPPTPKRVEESPNKPDSGPILPLHARKKGPIIVGGCKEYCEDPKNAFRNFTRALFSEGGDELPPWKTFIDTTTLVDNGELLGARWADMWVMKRHDERAAEVDSWLTAFRKRAGRVSDPQATEDALASGLQFRRLSSKEVEFVLIAPDRESSGNAGEWRIRMGRRGLEWLVQAIYD